MDKKSKNSLVPPSPKARARYLSRCLGLFIAIVSFLFSSCGAHTGGTTPDQAAEQTYSLMFGETPIILEAKDTYFESFWFDERVTYMSLSITPPEVSANPEVIENTPEKKTPPSQYPDYTEPGRVPPMHTAWGEAWNHSGIIVQLDEILQSNGVGSHPMRVRMIAHAIVASGWKQNVWNYNAWGVQTGSWDGPWFIKSTTEMDDHGNYYTVWDAQWRAFSSWEEAIEDYIARINPESSRNPYKEAYKWLKDPDKWADITYWTALKKGKYYTDNQFTSRRFASLCKHVRRELPDNS